MKQAGFKLRLFRVRQLRRALQHGRFAVPKLQREFVWNGSKAAKLLDSMYKGLPIGGLMIWRAPRSARLVLRETLHVLPPYQDANKEIWFLIDGQQRLSVIHQAFEGESRPGGGRREVDFARLSFRTSTPTKGEQPESLFAYRRPDGKEFVGIKQVLSSSWSRRLAHIGTRRLKRVTETRRRLLGYRVPAIFFPNAPLETVRELFIRINSLGTPIGAADRAFWRAATLDLRELARTSAKQLPEGFQALSDESMLQLLALVEGEGDVGERAYERVIRRFEGHATDGKHGKRRVTKTWRRMTIALGKALDDLRDRFAVQDQTWLPSSYMPVLLAVFYFQQRGAPSSRQRDEIRKWFWATAVGKRYSGRGFRQNIGADATFFRRLAKKGTARFRVGNRTERDELRRTEYGTGSALTSALYCLLALREPVFITSGESIPKHLYLSRANKKNRHHFFPRAFLVRRNLGRAANSICNICFLVAEENQSFGSKRPSEYLEAFRRKRYFRNALRRHLIPLPVEPWLDERNARRSFTKFIRLRRDLIVRAFEKAAGTRLFQSPSASS